MAGRLFAIARSFFFAALFISLFVWFIPRWVAAGKGVVLRLGGGWPWLLVAIGAIICLRCVWDFGWSGRGTPAPFDPPRRFVVTGFYRWVRNPMYIGFGLVLAGEALLLPAITRELFVVLAAYWAFVSFMAVFHEEPALQRAFGDDYARYRQSVRRWIPRLTPYADA